jgi:hypothetical protein
MNLTHEFLSFSKRLRGVKTPPLLSDAEARLAGRYTAKIRRACSAQLDRRADEKYSLAQRETSAKEYARALVLFARETSLSPGDADRILADLGGYLGGETPEERTERREGERARQADAKVIERAREYEARAAQSRVEYERQREAQRSADEKFRETPAGVILGVFEEVRFLVPRTVEQEALATQARALILASIEEAIAEGGYPAIPAAMREHLDQLATRGANVGFYIADPSLMETTARAFGEVFVLGALGRAPSGRVALELFRAICFTPPFAVWYAARS